MVLDLNLRLQRALVVMGKNKYFVFPLHEREQPAQHEESFILLYGSAKARIVALLNQHYAQHFFSPINLHNWLYHREEDEVAYFLNEAGSNAINHSDYKAPAMFHLWLGENGFIIGVEQQGRGFAVEKLTAKTEQKSGGEGFQFFQACKATIFFDNPKEARVVYFYKNSPISVENTKRNK